MDVYETCKEKYTIFLGLGVFFFQYFTLMCSDMKLNFRSYNGIQISSYNENLSSSFLQKNRVLLCDVSVTTHFSFHIFEVKFLKNCII